jgi:hypothetical protein
MRRKARVPQDGESGAEEAADLLGREVRRRCGPGSTFEERQAMARQVMAEAMALALEGEAGSDAADDDDGS